MNNGSSENRALAQEAGRLLVQLRVHKPRVHCITNAAAQVFTANLLLAAGAIPSLTFAAEEVASFVKSAAALLINLGTLDAERRAAIPLAIAAAEDQHLPWVLDPVFVERSPPRLAWAQALIARKPTILRCNGAELSALTGAEASASALSEFADAHHCVVALTAPTDLISDGARTYAVAHGHPLMSQTTAMGCAGTALIAAFASLTSDHLVAASIALLVLGIAGEIAAETARGPGSFVPLFLDALAGLQPDALISKARLT